VRTVANDSGQMRALGAYYRMGFRRYSTYRIATAAGAFTNTVFGLVKANILVAGIVATVGAAGSLAGYSVIEASTYAWMTQALISPVYVFTWNELALKVRTGNVAVDLCRPVDLQLSLLAEDLGRATYAMLPRGLPPLVVGALTFGLALPLTPLPYLLGLVSVVLGVAISFAGRFAVNLVAFWLLDVRGVLGTYVVVTNILCGLLVPVSWFPPWLFAIARATPFPSMLQTPVDVLTGRATGSAALTTMAVQACWLAATLALGRLLLHRATAKLVVQGG
jgi:ABC-2 type transport system permease protein